MIHLGFDIPPAAKALLSRQADITNLYQSVNVRISLYYILCTRPDNSDVQASELLEFNVCTRTNSNSTRPVYVLGL